MHNKQSIFSRLIGQSLQPLAVSALCSSALAIGVSGVAVAGNSPWYIAPQLGAISPDDERGDFDNGTLLAISVGRELGNQWAAELRAATFSLNGTVDDRNTDQVSLGLDVHWYPFGRLIDDAIIRPYLIAGLAVIDTEIGDNFSSQNVGTSIGLGASLRVFDTGLAVRAESRYATDFVDERTIDSFSDWQSTLGLQIPLGNQRETQASPVVQPAPAASAARKSTVAKKPKGKSTLAASRNNPAASSPTPKRAAPKPAPKPFSPFSQSAPASASAVATSQPQASKQSSPPPEPEVVASAPRKPVPEKPAEKAQSEAASMQAKPKVATKPPARIEPPKAAPLQPEPSNRPLLGSSTTDSDGDGIRNSVDLCAATPSGGYVDADGCPLQFGGTQTLAAAKPVPKSAVAPMSAETAKPVPPKPATSRPEISAAAKPAAETTRSATTIPLKGVSFASGSAELTAGSGKAIARVAGLMMKKPDLQVEIAGHTDNQGSKAANQELSERRAQAVKNALIAQGINFRRISTRGYGDTKPVASNETAAGKEENRRIELKLLRS